MPGPVVATSPLVLVLTPCNLAGAVGVSTETATTILGGTGADTLDFNSTVLFATVLGGTDAANHIEVAGAVTSSTLRGGTGNDTITFAGVLNSAVGAGGSGVDSLLSRWKHWIKHLCRCW